MKNGGSKKKGNRFENKLLRQVRVLDTNAHRTVGSGNTADDKGDVIFLDYVVEAKHHKRFTDSEINKYWEKINKEADYHNKIPLLVFKENRKKPVVMFWITTKGADGIIDHYRGMMFWEEFLYREANKRGLDVDSLN